MAVRFSSVPATEIVGTTVLSVRAVSTPPTGGKRKYQQLLAVSNLQLPNAYSTNAIRSGTPVGGLMVTRDRA